MDGNRLGQRLLNIRYSRIMILIHNLFTVQDSRSTQLTLPETLTVYNIQEEMSGEGTVRIALFISFSSFHLIFVSEIWRSTESNHVMQPSMSRV